MEATTNSFMQILTIDEMIRFNLISLWRNREAIIEKKPLSQRKELEKIFHQMKEYTFGDTQKMIDRLKEMVPGSIEKIQKYQKELDQEKSMILKLENNYLEFKEKIVNLWKENMSEKLSYEQFCDYLVKINEEV